MQGELPWQVSELCKSMDLHSQALREVTQFPEQCSGDVLRADPDGFAGLQNSEQKPPHRGSAAQWGFTCIFPTGKEPTVWGLRVILNSLFQLISLCTQTLKPQQSWSSSSQAANSRGRADPALRVAWVPPLGLNSCRTQLRRAPGKENQLQGRAGMCSQAPKPALGARNNQ